MKKPVDTKQLYEISAGGLLDRRRFLLSGASFMSAIALTNIASAHDFSAYPTTMKSPGTQSPEYGQPSKYENNVHRKKETFYSSPFFTGALTPLERLQGIITPSGLHFSIHHNGIPDISSENHQFMIHGMVGKALKWSINDLLTYPMRSQIQFLECSGNSAALAVSDTPTQAPLMELHGQVSCSEWTGVPLKYLLDEAEINPKGLWAMCEGADSGSHVRNVPLQKLYDDAILALYQNGERIRPDQGYPVRLFLPGYEGNMNVKWIHRMEISDAPSESKDEQSLYAEFTKDNVLRQHTFTMEVKSIITAPSGQQQLPDKGIYEISGLAWSGRGLIKKVEVSSDGGKSWVPANLEGPVMNKCFTRFIIPWRWNGKETLLLSRATDEHGNTQPTRTEWKSRYADFTFNHYNAVNAWHINKEGVVSNVYV